MKYVYELKDGNNQVVYVGITNNPKSRLRQHTRVKPAHYGNGKFYGRTDITIEVVAGPMPRLEALEIENELQKQYGLVTDRQRRRSAVEKNRAKIDLEKRRLLTYEDADKIRELYATGMYSQTELGEQFGVYQPVIYHIENNKTYVKK